MQRINLLLFNKQKIEEIQTYSENVFLFDTVEFFFFFLFQIKNLNTFRISNFRLKK